MIHPKVMGFLHMPNPTDHKSKNIEYLAKLIILNEGQQEVTSVNNLRKADNVFGRFGLTPEEAFHLNSMIHYLKGMMFALGSPEMEYDVLQLVQREITKVASGSSVFVPTPEELVQFGG